MSLRCRVIVVMRSLGRNVSRQVTPKRQSHELRFLLKERPRGKRELPEDAAAVRQSFVMNMHEPLASGPLPVTCVAQSGLRGFSCEAGGAVCGAVY